MPMTRMCQCSAVDIIHDTMVPDPYRWLENRTSPETGGWIESQQKRCEEYFESCNDLTAIRDRVRMCLDVVKLDQPVKVGRRYFYRRRDRGEEQASLYLNDQSTDTEQCLISPSNNGRFASVGIYRVSQSGALLAYETSRGGEDMKTIHFLDVTSGEVLSDRVQHGYPRGLEFAADDRSFYYCHETSPTARDHKIHLHHFHEPVADQVVFRVARTRESRLVLTADHLHIGAVWIHRLEHSLVADFWIARRSEPTKWKKVFAGRKLPFNPILKEGRIFALSYLEAPNGKVVELSLDGDEIRVVVPERQIKISHLMMRNKRIFANYTTHFCSSVMAWSLEGSDWEDVGIRKDGTVQFASNRGGDDDVFFYTYESFARSATLFEYLPESKESRIWRDGDSSPSERTMQVRRITYSSRDNTQIPMTIVSKQGASDKETRPAIMTSYGGFGVSMTPKFSVLVSVLLDLGAVLALPHIRGGGEGGDAWYEAARGRRRQVSFDDFISAAECLCHERITSPSQLGIFGGSNSGLLVAAAMTQRPDLFRAVLSIAPLLDMVRYEHFDQAARWRSEYGTVEDRYDFDALFAYSPYHRVTEGVNYPATMFVAGDKDSRCNAAHVRKMAARLESQSVQTNPVLVDYDPERGHSPNLPLSVRVDALTRRVAFLCRELGIRVSTENTNA